MSQSATNPFLIVGVLGGMGPEATVDFMAKILSFTSAERDQDHIRMLVDNNPGVPDRQVALTGDGEDPGAVLGAMAKGLENQGAQFLVMPCNTAHAWAPAIRNAVGIPLVSIIDETVRACSGFESVGLLSTAGCLESRVYQDGLESAGKQLVLPTADELSQIMELVYAVKGGSAGEAAFAGMAAIGQAMIDRGAAAIIAGCTEIPLILDPGRLSAPLIMSTDVLARATVAIARGERKLESLGLQGKNKNGTDIR